MGTLFGNIGNAIKKGVTDTGHAIGKVASNPIVDGAAGIFGGPLAGAALGGLGHLIAPGGNLGTAAKGALTGGAAGAVGAGVGKYLPLAVGAVTGHGGGTAGGTIPIAGDPSGSVDGDPMGGDVTGSAGGGISQSVLDGLKGALAGGPAAVASFLKDHGSDLLQGANIANAAYRQTKADGFSGKAIDSANSLFDSKAGLRTSGIDGMMNPAGHTPNLSNLQTLAGSGSGNPFTKGLPLASLTPAGQTASLPLAPSAPLTGVPNLPMQAPGTQTGTPPTIPPGMKPPAGFVPPKALPLAS